jgi:6,7-dimethyl-8-ribityllumazine synthase
MREIHGSTTAPGCRVALIVSRFNEEVTEGLLGGAREVLTEAGVKDDDVTVVRVPGAFEIPLAARRAAASGGFDTVVCLGCLIKGETMHFEYIASTATKGIADAALVSGVPMGFGLLTVLTDEQALARSGPGSRNKGREAALAALEMTTLLRQLPANLREVGP